MLLQSGGMEWVSGKAGIVGCEAKKVPLRCFLLHSGSVCKAKAKFGIGFSIYFGIASWPPLERTPPGAQAG